jgi:hypothetical protein
VKIGKGSKGFIIVLILIKKRLQEADVTSICLVLKSAGLPNIYYAIYIIFFILETVVSTATK